VATDIAQGSIGSIFEGGCRMADCLTVSLLIFRWGDEKLQSRNYPLWMEALIENFSVVPSLRLTQKHFVP
jgi:hypothetical protein